MQYYNKFPGCPHQLSTKTIHPDRSSHSREKNNMKKGLRILLVALAMAVATLTPVDRASASIGQCYNSGAIGCFWDWTHYRGPIWRIRTGFTGYCQMSSLNSWNNRISSYRNNTFRAQRMWTRTNFRGAQQYFSANGNYYVVSYSNNYESWKGYCVSL